MNSLSERDASRLRDMLENARLAQDFMRGKSRADLHTDTLLSYAVVRALEVIGEAANWVTAEAQAALPEIEWSNIIGMRHRVIHGYDKVNHDIVWAVVQNKLPSLIEQLVSALRPLYTDLDT